MKKQVISKIIFSKLLELPLIRYLKYIENTTRGITKYSIVHAFAKKKLFYAKIIIEKSTLCFTISDSRLVNAYPTENYAENKIICSLKWINTRNRFSLHILESLLDYQSEYWFSGKEINLKPLTLKKYLSLYPHKYLDESRLARLVPNLPVINPQNQFVNLKNLFISKKKYNSHLIKEIVESNENALTDKEIQCLLGQRGLDISVRTICNYRKLLNIPSYRERSIYCCYENDIAFSDYMMLSKIKNKITEEAGVYELSISSKISYLNYHCNVIYVGSSKNLRKRLANYLGGKLKNRLLKKFINSQNVFVRFCLTGNHLQIEKKLLLYFKKTYGELPKANTLGGWL